MPFSIVSMSEYTFQEAVCRMFSLSEQRYEAFVLRRSLFRRVQLVRPLVSLFYPDYLFNEIRLVRKVANATDLREIQEEVDFYQHKYVVNFMLKDALRFRLSGMRLMSLANKAFKAPARSSAREVEPPARLQSPASS